MYSLCCRRQSNWSDFADNLRELQRVAIAKDRPSVETDDRVLSAILTEKKNNLAAAMRFWEEWSAWRAKLIETQLEEGADMSLEVSRKLAVWTDAMDISGRKCCVVTPRNHSPSGRKMKSFRRYMTHVVEEGCLFSLAEKEAIEDQTVRMYSNEVCVIYDRRGFTSSSTDPDLVQNCQRLVSDLQKWYGHRLGSVYVVHLSCVLKLAYYLLLWPILRLFNVHRKIVILNNAAGLREYFEEGELRKTGIAMDSTLTCCASEHCHTASMQLSEERADDERTSLLV